MSNFRRLLKNKKVIFALVIFLILITGGLLWWQGNKEIKGSPDDYIVKETEEGISVENKKAGLVVRVPEGWEVRKVEFEEGAINFYSLDTDIELQEEKIVLPIKRGCLIQANVVYEEMDFEQIREEATMTHIALGVESDEFEEIIINNHKALKNIFSLRKYGHGIGIYIPMENKGYAFYLYWGSDEKEKCVQGFENFLEIISIK